MSNDRKPAALFSECGRKRLANLLTWGNYGKLLSRHEIEVRIEKALERIAAKVEARE